MFGTECFILMADFDQHGEQYLSRQQHKVLQRSVGVPSCQQKCFGQSLAFKLQMERMK